MAGQEPTAPAGTAHGWWNTGRIRHHPRAGEMRMMGLSPRFPDRACVWQDMLGWCRGIVAACAGAPRRLPNMQISKFGETRTDMPAELPSWAAASRAGQVAAQCHVPAAHEAGRLARPPRRSRGGLGGEPRRRLSALRPLLNRESSECVSRPCVSPSSPLRPGTSIVSGSSAPTAAPAAAADHRSARRGCRAHDCAAG